MTSKVLTHVYSVKQIGKLSVAAFTRHFPQAAALMPLLVPKTRTDHAIAAAFKAGLSLKQLTHIGLSKERVEKALRRYLRPR